MYNRPRHALAWLLGLMIICGSASASELLDASWKNDDLLIKFSDSVSYTIDLAESDSAQLVIRFHGITAPQSGALQGMNLRGRMGRRALLTEAGPGEMRLTLTGRGKLGYASLWRPYSHTLVVSTFEWGALDYPREQYYKALLALEQGLDAQGLELLRLAHSTGEPRAASVLGVYYARHGNPTLAAHYLAKPLDADDHAALAELANRSGDTTTAQASRAEFDRQNARRDSDVRGGGSPNPYDNSPDRMTDEHQMRTQMGIEKWIYLGGGALLLLIIIGLVIWLARRSSRKKKVEAFEAIHPKAQAVMGQSQPAVQPPVAQTAPATDVATSAPIAEPVAAAPAPQSAQPAPAEPVVEQPRAEELPGSLNTPEPAPAVAPVAAAAPVAPSAPIEPQSAPRSGRPVPTQAADLRRRVEQMRAAATAEAPRKPEPAAPTTNKQTITEARRLQLSRDSVELRRRLDEAADRQ